MRHLFSVLLLAGCASQQLHPDTQVFNLNEPIAERGILACEKQEDAVKISKSFADGGKEALMSTAQPFIAVGACVGGSAIVLYKKLVHTENREGIVHSVYQGIILSHDATKDVYIPMAGFVHK